MTEQEEKEFIERVRIQEDSRNMDRALQMSKYIDPKPTFEYLEGFWYCKGTLRLSTTIEIQGEGGTPQDAVHAYEAKLMHERNRIPA